MKWVEHAVSRGAVNKKDINLGELFNAEAQIRANASPSGICGTQSFTGRGFA
jgi:hypothetical protein